MAITIKSAPAPVSLAGSPLPFVVNSDAQTEDYHKILAAPFGNVQLGNEGIVPDQSGDVTFELSEFFRGFTYPYDGVVSGAVNVNGQKQIRFIDYYGNPPAEVTNNSWSGVILPGRVPGWRQQIENGAPFNFTNHINLKLPLTLHPGNKIVSLNQQERLTWYCPAGGTVSLTAEISYIDGTTQTVAIRTQGVNAHDLVYFQTGPGQIAITSYSAKKVAKYTLYLTGAFTSGRFSYLMDYSQYANETWIIFRNSLGGYDTLPCYGTNKSGAEAERQTYKRTFDVKNTRLNKGVNRTEVIESATVRSGLLQTTEKRWLAELAETEQSYESRGSILIPILITGIGDTSANALDLSGTEITYERLYNVHP